MTTQQRMQEKLEGLGIPFKSIHCYGSQIVITSLCETTARKWASIIAKFSTVRGITKSMEDAKENSNTVMNPTKVTVWRTFAVI